MANKSLRVEIRSDAYRRTMPFNRYNIEKLDGFLIMHFGLVSSSGHLLDSYSCGITELEVENQKKSLMDYLGRAGTLGDAPPAWQPAAGSNRVEICNFIGVCANNRFGEVTLNNVVGRAVAELKHTQTVIGADTIALLRSQIEVQKHWIKDLTK